MAQASTTVIAHGRAAAWNSYTKLAARLGVDPVALAEADVLGKLWDVLESHPEVAKTRDALAKCRQEPSDA